MIVRQAPDVAAVLQVVAATGERRQLGVLPFPRRSVEEIHGLPQGGLVVGVRDSTRRGLYRMGVPGLRDTLLRVSPAAAINTGFAVAPTGREAAYYVRDGARLAVEAVDLVTGRHRRVATARPFNLPFWLSDGSLVFTSNDDWYQLRPGERSIRPLLEAPFDLANYRLSANGLRAVANVTFHRGDVYMVRNFGDLLRR
jgi:hypothetical protein